MLNIDWHIEFKTNQKRYQLAMLAECEIFCSVDNLADTATIVLPEAVMNEVLHFENKLERGSEVNIKLGYNNNLKTEFIGYIKEITNNGGALKIICEDALFLFRKDITDKQLNAISLREVAQYIIKEIDKNYTLKCSYGINYEKFTIHQATGYDVLKKIQSETKANIYFDTEKKQLHIHPPYIENGGEVYYSMQRNIENSSLEFRNKLDTKIEVIVESTDIKGNVYKVTKGTTGGNKTTLKVGAMDKKSMQEIANAMLTKSKAASYKGSFDTWLVPFVKPSYSAQIKDDDYPSKTGRYYIASVVTNLSASGGKRTITPAIKLS